jgi:hypothetical protein
LTDWPDLLTFSAFFSQFIANHLSSFLPTRRAVNSRKQEIYNQVISFVQMNGRPASSINSTLMQQGEQVAEMLSNSGAIGAKIGRLRYLQPSCESINQSNRYKLFRNC